MKTMTRETSMAKSVWRDCLAMLVLAFSSTAFAVVMEDIEFSTLPGDKTEIRMVFDGAPPEPTGYTIEQPARIALDLSGVSSALSAKHHPLGSGNARSVTVVEAGERTRVIVAMTELVAYSARVLGNSLYVLVGEDDSGLISDRSVGIAASTGVQEDTFDDQDFPVVQEIDFRRGESGEGRVIVRLSDAGVGVDVSSEGGNIRVEFASTMVPEALQRRLDVTDFATPVMTVDTLPEDGDTVMIIEPSSEAGEFDYLAYQADKTFTLEVKPLTASDRDSAEQAFRFRGEKLSLNFQDIEIRSVLQLIADFTDLNLVASDTVAGRITLRLKNVPWDQALEIIMKTKGLDKRLVGNVLMVAPAAELQAREQLELESRQQMSELAPLRTEFIEVKYAAAGEIYGLFQSARGEKGGGEAVISSRGSVIVDERTNSIIITDTTERINDFRQVLDRLDVPVRQVLIEARIVTATSSFGESLGVRWGSLGFQSYDDGDTFAHFGGSLTTLGELKTFEGQDSGPLAYSAEDNLIVDLGAGGNASTFAFGIVGDDYLLDMELSALETEGRGEVIARPKVITADKQAASIQSGDQIPYQEASSSGATSTQFQDAVLGLTVTPRITPDDRIIMDLDINQDSIGAVFNGVPSIRTNSIQTQVLVNNGETIVLGGVFQTVISEGITKTPLLGDLPWVGNFFRRKSKSDDKQELLIFITPRLIRDSLTSR